MVRYFYLGTPFVIVGAVVLLLAPWLAVFALAILSLVALIALAALAGAIVFVPYELARAIGLRWHSRASPSPPTAAALSLTRRDNA